MGYAYKCKVLVQLYQILRVHLGWVRQCVLNFESPTARKKCDLLVPLYCTVSIVIVLTLSHNHNRLCYVLPVPGTPGYYDTELRVQLHRTTRYMYRWQYNCTEYQHFKKYHSTPVQVVLEIVQHYKVRVLEYLVNYRRCLSQYSVQVRATVYPSPL
jgi:hypothetical protein